MDQRSIFITSYDKKNLQISKDKGILGWKKYSKKHGMEKGDYVFVYNLDSRQMESVFEIESPYGDTNSPVWKEESDNNIIFRNRWRAKLLFDDLNLQLHEIANLFFNGKAQDFGLYVKNDFPKFLDDAHKGFRDFLLDKSVFPSKMTAKSNVNGNNRKYFLLQVGRKGSENLIENHRYRHLDWQSTPKDSDHGKVHVGDYLLVYFAAAAIKYHMNLKKIYEVTKVSNDSSLFDVKEVQDLYGLSLDEIKNAIDNEKLRRQIFGKLSQQGFNIKKIEKEDFDQVINLDNDLFLERYNKCKKSFPDEKDKKFIENARTIYNDFISLYPFNEHPEYIDNLTSDKLFEKGNKKTLFYMISTWGSGIGKPVGYYLDQIIKNFEEFKKLLRGVVDQTKSLTEKIDLPWDKIPQLGGDRMIAKKLVYIFNIDKSLAISTPDMEEMLQRLGYDFVKEALEQKNKEYSNLTLGEKYQLLTETLLEAKNKLNKDWDNITFNHFLYKCVSSRYLQYSTKEYADLEGASDIEIEDNRFLQHLDKTTDDPWTSLNSAEINSIIDNVLNYDDKILEIDKETIKRIVAHLICSKNVILIGAPGTGKTDLARRLLKVLGKRIIDKEDPVESVATYEWGRYEVIGGNSLKQSSNGDYIFHYGCVTKAIKENKLLLIDEFNRADMNKAFGEMFLALDHNNIELRSDENPQDIEFDKDSHSIVIPPFFRMICTMNDYDKSLLNDLSYGILRRFAFIELDIPPKDRLMKMLKERTMQKFSWHSDKENRDIVSQLFKPDTLFDKLADFIYTLHNSRRIGVATIIDIINYVLTEIIILERKLDETWKLFDNALVDYLLPQFDRLDLEVLGRVNESINMHFKVSDKILIPHFYEKITEISSNMSRLNQLFEFQNRG